MKLYSLNIGNELIDVLKFENINKHATKIKAIKQVVSKHKQRIIVTDEEVTAYKINMNFFGIFTGEEGQIIKFHGAKFDYIIVSNDSVYPIMNVVFRQKYKVKK